MELARTANVDGLWLGATDEVKEGEWKWSDGSPLTYTNWSPVGNQPNNKRGVEHYLMLLLGKSSGEWCDQPTKAVDFQNVGYICEWNAAPGTPFPALPAGAGKIDKEAPATLAETNSGLKYRVLRKGSGWSPGASDTVKVNYQGWLDDGTIFDSSYKRGEPALLPLAGVVKGWAEGMEWIGEGGMIELEVPPVLGYGNPGRLPDIPPNAKLHYLIELIEVTGTASRRACCPRREQATASCRFSTAKISRAGNSTRARKAAGTWMARDSSSDWGRASAISIRSAMTSATSICTSRHQLMTAATAASTFEPPFGPAFPSNNPQWPVAYEAQINSTGRDARKTGSLFVGVGKAAVALHEMLAPPDKWFTLEVLADGNHIVIKIDGRVTADYVDVDRQFTRGRLALQQYDPQTVVKFHKIEIRVGKPDPAAFRNSQVATVQPGGAESPRNSKPADPMARARSDHEAALKKAEEVLAARFDREIEALRRGPAKSDDRLKLIDALKLEKATFDTRKTIPWSLPMPPPCSFTCVTCVRQMRCSIGPMIAPSPPASRPKKTRRPNS